MLNKSNGYGVKAREPSLSFVRIYIYIYIGLMAPILAYAVILDEQSDFKILVNKKMQL